MGRQVLQHRRGHGAHERPQDPRFKGSVAQTRKAHHDDPDSLYGLTVNGHLLGSGTK